MKLERLTPLLVFGVALGIRLLHAQQVTANDPFWDQPSVDSQVYVEWAKQLAAGLEIRHRVRTRWGKAQFAHSCLAKSR